jgi:hypothetical protein
MTVCDPSSLSLFKSTFNGLIEESRGAGLSPDEVRARLNNISETYHCEIASIVEEQVEHVKLDIRVILDAADHGVYSEEAGCAGKAKLGAELDDISIAINRATLQCADPNILALDLFKIDGIQLFSDLYSESLTIQQAMDVYHTFDANHWEILGHLGSDVTNELSGPF